MRLEEPDMAMAIATADTRGILNPQRGASHFALTRHAPAPEVAERIDRHWIVRWDLRGRSPFRPGAFAAFVDIPMSRLVGRSVSVAEAFGSDGSRLEREVVVHDDEAEQVAAVERFVAARLPEDDEGFELVGEIVADMLTLPPGTRVEEVAARHDLSDRTLQ